MLANPPKEIRKSFRAYLYGVAHHVWFRHYEQLQRSGRSDELSSSLAELTSTISHKFGRQQEAEQLLAALELLDPGDRELIEQHHIHELPVAVMAEIHDVPIGTIKSRLSLARGRLRAVLSR